MALNSSCPCCPQHYEDRLFSAQLTSLLLSALDSLRSPDPHLLKAAEEVLNAVLQNHAMKIERVRGLGDVVLAHAQLLACSLNVSQSEACFVSLPARRRDRPSAAKETQADGGGSTAPTALSKLMGLLIRSSSRAHLGLGLLQLVPRQAGSGLP